MALRGRGRRAARAGRGGRRGLPRGDDHAGAFRGDRQRFGRRQRRGGRRGHRRPGGGHHLLRRPGQRARAGDPDPRFHQRPRSIAGGGAGRRSRGRLRQRRDRGAGRGIRRRDRLLHRRRLLHLRARQRQPGADHPGLRRQHLHGPRHLRPGRRHPRRRGAAGHGAGRGQQRIRRLSVPGGERPGLGGGRGVLRPLLRHQHLAPRQGAAARRQRRCDHRAGGPGRSAQRGPLRPWRAGYCGRIGGRRRGQLRG